MAALPHRALYDCAVLGEGWSARLIAQTLSKRGLNVVLVADEPRPVDAWLHPRLAQDSLHDLPRLLPTRGIMLRDAAGDCLQVLRSTNEDVIAFESHYQSLTHALEYSRNARFVVQLEESTLSASAVGGIYRDVNLTPDEDDFAHLFQTQLPGVIAWLVAIENGLFSLGVVREEDSLEQDESAAELLEESLVACPGLTGRLARAQLVGGLHTTSNQTRGANPTHPEAILLRAYDNFIDPLFASGYERAQRCATEFADLMLTCCKTPAGATERIAAWQHEWRAREQSLRSLVAWHDPAPPPLDKRPNLRLSIGSAMTRQ